MTTKEAIKQLENVTIYHDGKCTRETLDKAIEALENQEKYKWHDLRKNPDDIPDYSVCERIIFLDDSGEYDMVYPHSQRCKDYIDKKAMIAWRETEPFKREEKNDT